MSSPETVTPGKPRGRRAAIVAALVAAIALGYALWQHESQPRFLQVAEPEFVALFVPPPAANSAQTRGELDELLAIQQQRSSSEVETARVDRKTEVWQFAEALGLQRDQMESMDALDELATHVEDDVRHYVRAAKYQFLRLRPYEIETRIEPCIDDVRGDLSYPSGHATYGYVMALMLSDMVPERREELMARAQEFARQRAVCGVHFPSDLEAGRVGAEWLWDRLRQSTDYRTAAETATRELRSAMGLSLGVGK